MSDEGGKEALSNILDFTGEAISGFGDWVKDDTYFEDHVAVGLGLKAIGESIQAEALGLETSGIDLNYTLTGMLAGALVGSVVAGAVAGGLVLAPEVIAAGIFVGTGYIVSDAALTAAGYMGTAALNLGLGYLGTEFGKWIGGKLDEHFQFPTICPLAIDLDGGGINFTSLTTSGAYFDLDNDGFAERTAWIGSGDGFLVRDLNANGKIDNISEMFGSNGGGDGFNSLAALDSNSDGVISAADTSFGDLKIWKDANGDGITQVGELTTLGENGITSISLSTTSISDEVNGVELSSSSTVEFTGGIQREVADAWLPNNQWDTVQVDQTNMSMVPAAFLIPELHGYGNVTDFRYAISNSPDLMSEAQTIVADRDSYTSFGDFRDDIQTLLLNWIGTADAEPGSRGSFVDASHLAALEQLMGQPYGHVGAWPTADSGKVLEADWSDIVDQFALRFVVQLAHYDQFSGVIAGIQALVAAVLANPDMSSDDINAAVDAAVASLGSPASTGFMGQFGTLAYDPATDSIQGDVSGVAATLFDHAEHDFFTPPAAGADTSAFLSDMSDSYRLLIALLNSADDPSFAAMDTTISGHFGDLHYTAPDAVLVASFDSEPVGTSASELIYDDGGYDTLTGGMGSDTYVHLGTSVDTVIEGYDPWSADRLVFDSADASTNVQLDRYSTDPEDLFITFSGQYGSVEIDNQFAGGGYGVEAVQFGDGVTMSADQLWSLYFEQHQTAGDDYVYGAPGSTTYNIDTIAGHDTFVEDQRPGETDVLALGTEYVSTAVHVDHVISYVPGVVWDDAIITFAGKSGSIDLQDEFTGNGAGLEQIQFGDGVTWSLADIELAYLQQAQTPGNDTILSFSGSTVIPVAQFEGHDYLVEDQDAFDTDQLVLGEAFHAADIVVTRQSSDVSAMTLSVNGHEGSLTIENQAEGGGYGVEQILFASGEVWTTVDLEARYVEDAQTAGDDTIYGFAGDTTFHINDLAGDDHLIEAEFPWQTDTIDFGGTLSSTAVHVARDGDSTTFTLTFSGHTGSLTIDRGFEGYGFGVEQFHFSDNVTWSVADIEAAYLNQVQTSGDDSIYGFGSATTFDIASLAGNDTIYEFTDPWDTDRVVFGAGLNESDVAVTRSSNNWNDVTLSFAGQSGSLTLHDEFSGSGSGVEEVQFGDDTVWTLADLKAAYLAQAQTAGDDFIMGFADATTYTVDALAGNDAIFEDTDPWDTDELDFGSSLTSADVHIGRSGTDLNDAVLTFAGQSGSITLDKEFDGSGAGVEEIHFGDGIVWNLDDLKAAYIAESQTSGDDAIYGFVNDSTTFKFDTLAGNDTIYESEDYWSTDKLKFGAEYVSTDVIVTQSGSDSVTLSFQGHSGSVTLDGQLDGWGKGIEEIVFGDDVHWSQSDLLNALAV